MCLLILIAYRNIWITNDPSYKWFHLGSRNLLNRVKFTRRLYRLLYSVLKVQGVNEIPWTVFFFFEKWMKNLGWRWSLGHFWLSDYDAHMTGLDDWQVEVKLLSLLKIINSTPRGTSLGVFCLLFLVWL